MKSILKSLPAAAAMLLALQGTAVAQREVLSREERAGYEAQLPEAAAGASVTALQNFLRDLLSSETERKAAVDEQAVVGEAVSDGGSSREASSRKIANAVRVAADARAVQLPVDAFYGYYAVPAMSSEMRLPDAYPRDGRFRGEIGVVLARDEYEPASFVLFPFVNTAGVQLKVTDLKSEAGDIFPADNLDLKVVKVWYQNGNGWYSYFQDVGLQLVPELLLNDENLIRVDTGNRANYARVAGPGGNREVWISAPRKIDVGFDAYQEGFADASTLRPVELKAGEFKQFVLTAHAASDARPGTYRGSIEVNAPGHAVTAISVSVRVLPFRLPSPRTNYDLDKDFLVTLMGAWPRLTPEHPAFMPTLRDLRRHNILHLGPGVGPNDLPERAEAQVKAMKEAGFQTDFIFGGNLPWVGAHDGTPLTFDDLVTMQRSARAWSQFYRRHFGETTAALVLGDEQSPDWVAKTRPAWRVVNREGLQTNLAGHQPADFGKGGYMLDVRPIAGSPASAELARQWKAIGHGHTAFYANQHNGSENPDFVRRQHGLLGYLSDFDMVNNYEFAYGPWNDLVTEVYKPMVLAYPTRGGLVDTLAWEGFREAIDDIRYATKLRQLARDAITSGELDKVYEGRKVHQWLAAMDGSKVELNAVRMEMIEKILRLEQMDLMEGKQR